MPVYALETVSATYMHKYRFLTKANAQWCDNPLADFAKTNMAARWKFQSKT